MFSIQIPKSAGLDVSMSSQTSLSRKVEPRFNKFSFYWNVFENLLLNDLFAQETVSQRGK